MNEQPAESHLEDPSLAFASKMIGLVVLCLLTIGMPMAYLRILPRFLDVWTLLILVVVLLFLKRILKRDTSQATGTVEETWEDYANGRVHEVKNLLLDFQPDQHGGPGGLADYLEQSQEILDETITYLREKEKEEAEETQ